MPWEYSEFKITLAVRMDTDCWALMPTLWRDGGSQKWEEAQREGCHTSDTLTPSASCYHCHFAYRKLRSSQWHWQSVLHSPRHRGHL